MEITIKDVSQALENKEVKVYFQPQYDANTGQMKGAEALARWIKPDGTIVMPKDFIPFMEREGLILGLDWYMLEEVCIFLKKQKEQGAKMVPISVNFSRKHLEESDFEHRLNSIIDLYGVSHETIVVEITETTFADDIDVVKAFCNKVRQNGYKVAIDDFGSGFSSLSFLKDIDIDILKIDRSLLKGNFEDDKERIVLETIIMLANRLKLCTVAEGVETKEQLGFLRTCDCMEIQGFLFAKPMPASDFEQLCREESDVDDSDVLLYQNRNGAVELLLEAVFDKFPLVIFANLTKNSYYMMTYENFTTTHCTGAGRFDDLIIGGASTMHPDDRDLFRMTFERNAQIEAYEKGAKRISLVTRQKGDDGAYRRVETTIFFSKNPTSNDLLIITLCSNLE